MSPRADSEAKFWHPKQYASWILGAATGLALAAVSTYYRAEQIPQIAAQLSDMNVLLNKLNQRLDDSQRERDQIRADIAELRAHENSR